MADGITVSITKIKRSTSHLKKTTQNPPLQKLHTILENPTCQQIIVPSTISCTCRKMQSEVPYTLTCNNMVEVPRFQDISTGINKGSVAIAEAPLSRQAGSNKQMHISFIKGQQKPDRFPSSGALLLLLHLNAGSCPQLPPM